jgi:hypothetical protein
VTLFHGSLTRIYIRDSPGSGTAAAVGAYDRWDTELPESTGEDNGSAEAMKIKSHSESHIVELDDGSRWQIFPGDLDVTLNWKPETELTVVSSDDDVSSHMLMGEGVKVHVIAAGESWPVKQVKSVLKEG